MSTSGAQMRKYRTVKVFDPSKGKGLPAGLRSGRRRCATPRTKNMEEGDSGQAQLSSLRARVAVLCGGAAELPHGATWRYAGRSRPAAGRELTHAGLAEALHGGKTRFTDEEWGHFGIITQANDFILAGRQYFALAAADANVVPADAASDHEDELKRLVRAEMIRHDGMCVQQLRDLVREQYLQQNLQGPGKDGVADGPEPRATDDAGGKDKDEGEDDPASRSSDSVWTQANTNAFGAFVHVGLQSGLKKAVLKCLPMVILALTIQNIFSEELVSNHQKHLDIHYRSRDSICWVPWKFQLSAVTIFVTLVCHNVPGMVIGARLVFQSTHHKLGDGEHIGDLAEAFDTEEALELVVPLHRRVIIFVIAVLSEWITWFHVLYAGCLFAITATTIDNVIRSTVSVMFVLNVDEIVFDSCCPLKIADDVKETEYLIPKIKVKDALLRNFQYYYTLYGHLPLLISFSVGVVFLVRWHMLQCPSDHFGQDYDAGVAIFHNGGEF